MSKQFLPDSEENLPGRGEKGNSRQALLLVLLVLVAVFGYLYFFTGLIKPREEAAKAPAMQAAQVKKPMPPRKEQPAGNVEPTAKPEEKKQAAAKPSAGEPGQAKPAPAQKQMPAPAPAKAPAKAEPVKTAKAAAPADRKAAAKPAPATKPKVQAKTEEKASAPAKPSVKKPAPVAVAAKPITKPAEKQVAGSYTLKIGAYVLEKNMRAAEAKLKKLAITPVERQKMHQTEPMHRLFYAEFPDHESAVADLKKLQKIAPDAFLLKESDKFVIYAGSYYSEGKAAIEQDRLFDKGVKLVLKKAEVGVPVTVLTAGSFAGKDEAQKAVARLKKAGISATVINAGKKKG